MNKNIRKLIIGIFIAIIIFFVIKGVSKHSTQSVDDSYVQSQQDNQEKIQTESQSFIMSYRENESDYWENDFEVILNSLRIRNRK